ncbi:hypothetical protein ARMGADRAFT_1167628 [Armillaria gallica]|uniref:Uncharacterized protein n=1 Tax=Armillaria gallica TaxID=47427 RepID=A0A2H3DM66_ARMGA|nr:hypothetical protein ARMGADRAFT_1167628 [Armillaria gallica]
MSSATVTLRGNDDVGSNGDGASARTQVPPPAPPVPGTHPIPLRNTGYEPMVGKVISLFIDSSPAGDRKEVNRKKGSYYVGASAQTGHHFKTTSPSARQAK